MADLLRMDYINSLPQPFMVVFCGDDTEWELADICVETGLLRIFVSGLLEIRSIGEVRYFIDMDRCVHAPDTFYTDYEPEKEKWV